MEQTIFITVRQAAAELGVSPVAVLDLFDEGRLSGDEVSGQTFISRASVEKYAQSITAGVQQ